MTHEVVPNKERRSSAEIESDIRQTRGRMDATLDELGNRLTARSVLNSALDWWESRNVRAHGRGAPNQTYQLVTEHVKESPLPSLLIGVGVIWMIIDSTARNVDAPRSDKESGLSSKRSGSPEGQAESRGRGLVEDARSKLEEAKEAITGAAGTVKEKVAAMGESAGQTADDVSRHAQNVYEQSRSTARTVGRSLQRGYQSSAEKLANAVEEYPLAVGIGFAALGALIGVLLPRTRREDELLGAQSDQVVEATKEKGEELLQRSKTGAQRVGESVLKEAKQQGLTPEAVGDKISEVAGKVWQVVHKAKEEAETAAKEEKLTAGNLKEEASSAAHTGKRKASARKKSGEEG